MNDDSNLDRIEQYIFGNMDSESHQAFQNAMEEDLDLKKEVLFHQELLQGIKAAGDIHLVANIELAEIELTQKDFFSPYQDIKDSELEKGIHSLGDKELKNQIQETENKIGEEGFFDQVLPSASNPAKTHTAKTSSLFNRRILAVAASILFLITAGIFFLRNSSVSNEKIYANHFEINEALIETQLIELNNIGLATKDKEQKQRLKTMLESYQKCTEITCKLEAINQQLETYPEDQKAKFYLAITLMEYGKYSEAAKVLEELTNIEGFELEEEVQWYQALCYLKIEAKRSEAQMLFNKIANSPASKYAESAAAIIKDFSSR